MQFARSSGVLCHPTAFPSRYGIGDLGPAAYDFVNWLASCRQQLWQILPLGPTGYADSPYQSFSAFAGNPLLISPDQLVWQGLLPPEAAADRPDFPEDRVDFGAVAEYKHSLLRRSYEHFLRHNGDEHLAALEGFRRANCEWLSDFALFMALKHHFGGGSWQDWPDGIRTRAAEDLSHYRHELAAEATYHEYVQWLFFRQWGELKSYSHSRGIRVIGDIPIFVAEDSADIWSRPELFQLDADGRPTVVAGVPPDNFSHSGQRWGNPHYRWDVMANDDYAWWLTRIKRTLEMVDILRIDHFRGFEAYWEVPAAEATAVKGRWVQGPGARLFEAVQRRLGEVPIIAEDLGVITPEVEALREQFQFPGMKVLQFGFALDTDSKYLPHNYQRDCIVYPGTHDNNTVAGWFDEAGRTPLEKWLCLRYLASDGSDLPWDFIRAAWSSVADLAVVQLQDVMSLGREARMNHPSTTSGNWQWRYTPALLTDSLRARLLELTQLYQRAGPPEGKHAGTA